MSQQPYDDGGYNTSYQLDYDRNGGNGYNQANMAGNTGSDYYMNDYEQNLLSEQERSNMQIS